MLCQIYLVVGCLFSFFFFFFFLEVFVFFFFKFFLLFSFFFFFFFFFSILKWCVDWKNFVIISLVGSTGKSLFSIWITIHNTRAGFRWCTRTCSVENTTTCNDGASSSSCIFNRLCIYNHKVRSINIYQERPICSKHCCMFDFYCKLLSVFLPFLFI